MGTNFSLAFHDITSGNNTNQTSGVTRFQATTGYDLCSGWGSPFGTGLINLLSPPVAPAITSSSNSVVGFLGRSVTLTFTAIGTPSLTYQWLLNGTPIVGATSPSLTLTNISSASAGLYSVTVTNTYGSNTKVVARLTTKEAIDTPLWSPWQLGVFGLGLMGVASRTWRGRRQRYPS